MTDPFSSPLREVKLDVLVLVLPELVQDLLAWRSEDIVDFIDLVQLIRSWEQREEAHYLEEYTADAPDVHFIVIVPLRQ